MRLKSDFQTFVPVMKNSVKRLSGAQTLTCVDTDTTL